MCVWDHCPFGTPNAPMTQISWLMILGLPEGFGDNPPSLFHLLSSELHPLTTAPHHDTATTMPYRRYGVLGVKGLTFYPPNILLLIVAKQFFIWTQIYSLQNTFSLSMWSVANCSQALRYCVWIKGFFLAQQPFSPWMMQNRLDCWHCPFVFQQLLIHCRLAFRCFLLNIDHPDNFSFSRRW